LNRNEGTAIAFLNRRLSQNLTVMGKHIHNLSRHVTLSLHEKLIGVSRDAYIPAVQTQQLHCAPSNRSRVHMDLPTTFRGAADLDGVRVIVPFQRPDSESD
jgi:hypothetical protein